MNKFEIVNALNINDFARFSIIYKLKERRYRVAMEFKKNVIEDFRTSSQEQTTIAR